MSPRLLATALVLALPCARAQLPSRSPFVPGENDAATPTASPFLEFFGYIESADGMRFRVNDPARKTGAWVRLNEPNETLGIVAKGHDASRELLFVERQGQPLTLPMHRAKIVNSGPALGAGPIVTPTTPPANPSASAAANQASANLDKLAEAIAQRRAARAQAVATPPPAAK